MEWQAAEEDSSAPDTISYSNAEHNKLLSKELNDLRNKGVFCDIVLRVGEKTFPAHKCVLASFSPYFNAMFTSDMKESHDQEVTLNDIEPAILESLLQYFYTGTIDITQANVQSLVTASNLLQVLSVRNVSSLFMAKHIDASNCLGIQSFAEVMDCEDLLEAAKEFALSNLPDLAGHEEFLNLPLAKLIELVSSDALDVPREEDVFTAVLKWFNHQPEARKDGFHQVLACVRLPLMSHNFLHDFVAKQEIIRTSLECFTLLQDALECHALPDQRGDMQSARSRPRSGTKLVDLVVCAGGDDCKSRLRCMEVFDPISNQWASLCDMPFAVGCAGAVVSEQNMLYVAGGYFVDGDPSNRLLKFDPQVNKFEEMASMSYARAGLGIAVLDGFLYAVGGWADTDPLDSAERYNIETNEWEQMPALRSATSYATVLAHGGYLYVVGGDNIKRTMRRVQRFDPRTQVWTDMAPMLIARRGSTGCALDGKLYITGGSNGSGVTNKVECYDIHNNQWNACSPMRVGRSCPGAALMGGHIYVFGGYDDERIPYTSVERYTPETDRWEDVAEMTMTSPRSRLACAALKVRKSLLWITMMSHSG